jgi:hypothetical protein
MSENETVIGEVRKNGVEVIKVSLATFRGRVYIGMRVWVKGDGDTGEGRPASRGLTLRPAALEELMPKLAEALELARKMGDGR